MRVVFLTGATGCVGSRLAAELLQEPDTALCLLARGGSPGDAERRVRRILEFWGVSYPEPSIRSRIQIVPGDITQPRLGIDGATFDDLTQRVTHVIHAAADIKLNLDPEQARRVSVGGTREVVALSRRAGARRFVYMSTTEVAGDYDGVVREEFLSDYRRRFLNSYEVAKAETEEYLREELEAGLPVTVFRPSMVVGEATRGKTTRFGSFYYLLSDMLLSRRSFVMPGSPTLVLDTVPVDFLARAVTALLDDPAAQGKVYHLTAGQDEAVPLRDFVQLGRRVLGESLDIEAKPPLLVSPTPVRAVLRTLRALSAGQLRRKLDNQLILIEFFFLNTRFDNSRLRRALEPHHLAVPRLEHYLPALCAYYLNHRVGRGGVPRELR